MRPERLRAPRPNGLAVSGWVGTARRRARALQQAVGGPKGAAWGLIVAVGFAYSVVVLVWAAPVLGVARAALVGRAGPTVLAIAVAIAGFVATYVGYGSWFWYRLLARRNSFLEWWRAPEADHPADGPVRPVGLTVPLVPFLLALTVPPERTAVVVALPALGVLAAGGSVLASRRLEPQPPESDQWAVPVALLVHATALHAAVVLGSDGTMPAATTAVWFEVVLVGTFFFGDLDRRWLAGGPWSYGLEAAFLLGGAGSLAAAWLARSPGAGLLLTAMGVVLLVAAVVALTDRLRGVGSSVE